ncbi:MAG: alpha/beta hydrolase [Gammaproteobacteria bacterium]|nr:alpha/beta hydrolase [Gammaproteobacteria bacterium]NNE05046.1 alpha/beta hydrolase [Xanthomonadales bacterium]
MTELSGRLHSWRASGRVRPADGVEIWYRQFSKRKTSLPWLVCFHGFPTSSWDWHRLLPLIEDQFRILVFDFPGYGLSAKLPGRDYSLLRQFDAAESLLEQLRIDQFHLLAHDMGVTVACELMHRVARGETSLKPLSYNLLNGGIYPELHRPLPTQRLLRTPVLGPLTARFASWRLFRHQYPQVYARPQEFSDEHYREQWSLVLNNRGRRTLAAVAAYMPERLRRRERWLGALHGLRGPAQLIWGVEDPIAVVEMAHRVATQNPTIALNTLENTGHYPQLEAPEAVAKRLFELAFH